ncbi:MAG: hypothetical protein J6W67_06445, partial [Lentisphaeria bacterium]|nr:hypothetical protein [Lentisphaeria bacterium]
TQSFPTKPCSENKKREPFSSGSSDRLPDKGGVLGEGENFFSREKKFSPSPNPIPFQEKRCTLGLGYSSGSFQEMRCTLGGY